MTYNNFSISSGKGKLYLKEKQPTQGYEEVSYGTEGKKTYHQYHDSIKGIPKYFDVKEVQYDGKTLKFMELSLVDGDVSNKVSVPLKNTKGGYTDEARALLSALVGMDLNEEVTLSTKTTTTTGKNGKEYKNLNLYINYVNRLGDNGKGASTGFIPYSEIPAPIEKIVAGDKTWDWSPQTEFFYSKLQEVQAKFQNVQTASQPQVNTEAPKIPVVSPSEAFDKVEKQEMPEKFDKLPF
jgi:hypothetical protein